MSNTKMKRPATPAQMAALTRANEARAKLQDAPYQRNRKKMEMALKWTHAWGATTSKILCQVVGVKQQDFITGMVKSKVLRIVKVLNKTFYLCTAHGRSVLVSSLPENEPLRHVQLTRTPLAWGFEHSEKAQELLAKKISEYGDLVEAWASEKELRFLMAKNKKIPDCAIYLRDGRVIFYEIEITKKYNQELDSMIFNLICLAAEEIQITCEIHLRKSLFNHYQGALREIKETGLYWYWSKDVNGKWHRSDVKLELHPVFLEALDRVVCVVDGQAPSPSKQSIATNSYEIPPELLAKLVPVIPKRQ